MIKKTFSNLSGLTEAIEDKNPFPKCFFNFGNQIFFVQMIVDRVFSEIS